MLLLVDVKGVNDVLILLKEHSELKIKIFCIITPRLDLKLLKSTLIILKNMYMLWFILFVVTVNVIEESQYPPIISPLSIEIFSYLDDFPGSLIGQVHASDQEIIALLDISLTRNFI